MTTTFWQCFSMPHKPKKMGKFRIALETVTQIPLNIYMAIHYTTQYTTLCVCVCVCVLCVACVCVCVCVFMLYVLNF